MYMIYDNWVILILSLIYQITFYVFVIIFLKKVWIPIFKINSLLKFKKIGVESFSLFLFSFLSQASIILIKLQLKKISFDCLIVKSQQQYAYLIWKKVPNKKCPLIFHRWFTYSCTLNVSAKYNTSPSPTESTVPLR